MSIKDLFNKQRNIVSQTTNKELTSDVESTENISQKVELKNTFVPQIDYSEPENFTKYGSAYLYYKSAIERIYDFFPYDGSDAEINSFINRSLPHERYVFDNLYPRTNGYANFDGASYISLKGGPHGTSYSTLSNLFKDVGSTKRSQANLYETNIYEASNKPSDYGGGSRESNLKCNFEAGVSVEFWLKGDAPSSNTKQTIFHLTNSSGGDALTIFLSGTTGSPFHVSLDESSTSVFSEQQLGSTPTTSSLTSWHHYAITFKSASSGVETKLFLDGRLDTTQTFGTTGAGLLTQKDTLAYIASGSAGYLSASMDEFRFWKSERNAYEIGTNYFGQVRGGANTDVSNASLGVYYKFNEGTTGVSSLDEIVLDYAGRITNGTWNGTVSRTLESAIVEAGAASSEFKDPIIYNQHPDVASLKSDLETKGRYYDSNNPTKFINHIPSWVIEENESEDRSDLEMVSHIIGSYFDKLYLQIQSISDFKQPLYTSSSYKPLTFARYLPQSLGLYTPEIFVDSDIVNTISNKTENFNFESDLEDTKNLIYLNLYNNLASIFKSKGTEKSIKSVLRCFYIDDQIVKLNTYSNKARYELRNNLEQTTKLNNYINFNSTNNVDAVVYQRQNPSDTTNTIGYISGSEGSGYELPYGATIEADITFPYFKNDVDVIDRRFTQVSLFGVVSASVDSPNDTTFAAPDNSNFQIFAVREEEKSKNAYFKLTSSIFPFPFPELTSSVFYNVYNNQDWNFSVSVIPTKSGSLNFVDGASDYSYTLKFEGYNTILGDVRDSFSLTESLTKAQGQNFLKSAKRVYAGAYKQNITGSLVHKSDVLLSGVRYWLKSIDYDSKKQHALDFDNIGVSKTYENISILDSQTKDLDVLNKDTLALAWDFNNVTGSDASGNFYVTDYSSGSALIRDNYGWIGNISGYRHSGYGHGFITSSSGVLETKRINLFKFVDPERTISSDMVTLVDDSQVLFGIPEDVVSYHHTLEKSMYSAVSDEMLKFFAGAADFNNLIGEPVNRYRARYKAMEKLRQAFFLRVGEVKEIERYIEYYKWFDDSLGDIIKQLIPGSAVLSENVYDVVESHVLERNKYESKFPTIEFKAPDPETPMLGIREKTYDWKRGHHPVENIQTKNSNYWRKRAERAGSDVISSGDSGIDEQRDTIIETADKFNNQTAPTFAQTNSQTYSGQTYVLRKLSRPYRLTIDRRTNPPRIFKGGTNFEVNKKFGIHRIALHPAGPINTENNVFVPRNVLLGFTEDMVLREDTTDPAKNPNILIKRNIKVQSGRDWEEGLGYKNLKSDITFPFNIVSSSVATGYNKQVVDRVTGGIEITNVHNDVYGEDMEKPLQGPFTEYAVGGLQYRHVKLNDGSDNYLNRPEGWKILLGLCTGVTGAVGMVGADYPYPEANAVGQTPYPMTGAQKAFLYRDMVAKRPVNIKNIQHKTGSTILGNYNHNYDIINSVGAYSNPKQFVENQPTLPADTFTGNTTKATSVRSFLDTKRTENGHTDFVGDYSVDYLHSGSGKSIIISRFAAPGGIEVMTKGYQDFRASEYSVYNSLNARNLAVRRPFQPFSSSVVSETTGYRVSDIHGQDFGLENLSARHAARFYRDSTLVLDPGASYEESPSFHKIHRNTMVVAKETTPGSETYVCTNKYDNLNVQHQIPRSDRQYAWITSSIVEDSCDARYYGFMKTGFGIAPGTAPYYEITGTYVPFFNYVSASAATSGIYQNTTRLDLLVLDKTGSDANTLGEATISGALQTPAEAERLNALLIHRGDNYGWGHWRSTQIQDHPLLSRQKKNNEVTQTTRGIVNTYKIIPFDYSGRTVKMNVNSNQETATLEVEHNNYRIYAGSDYNNAVSAESHPTKTAFDVVAPALKDDLNWLVYREKIFPSRYKLENRDTLYRNDYDNLYWRTTRSNRDTLGATFNNSFNISVSQSSWVLDAPDDFLTRVDAPTSGNLKNVDAGELQNTYFSYHRAANPDNAFTVLSPAGLYSRKHMLTRPRSVVSPSGIGIPSADILSVSASISIFGGEAVWEAGANAGIINNNFGTPTFVAAASEPWFNNYDDFKSELKLISRDYTIVPEFRISEKVADYLRVGTDGNGLTDVFEIVGTSKNSSNNNFYKDYTNSEFLKEFANVSETTDTTPKELRLVCKAVTRFVPYKGFYPAQRTLDIVQQFSSSFQDYLQAGVKGQQPIQGDSLIYDSGSILRPLLQPLFAPGILYNTIKSGISVDFPVVTTPKINKIQVSGTSDYAIYGYSSGENSYSGGQFWDQRLPFEAILRPELYLGDGLFDLEPHPSASILGTASFGDASGDPAYSRMSKNFFAEVADFFLKDSEYTTLKSGQIQGTMTFPSGSVYGARLKMRRSVVGPKNYGADYDSFGNRGISSGSAFTVDGMRVSSSFGFGSKSIPLPQDPKNASDFKETFTMYSRPTAFGPPVIGRETSGNITYNSGALDSLSGYNWSFTPPYYHGEAWADLIFYPENKKQYTLEDILAEIQVKYWRVDSGFSEKPLLPTGSQLLYGAENCNDNAMQLNSCLNLFGIEEISFEELNENTGQKSSRNEVTAKRWVIQPKAETPMMNFNDSGINAITNANGYSLSPTFASESVPRGMWHQFGNIPERSSKGIFLEIGDIPKNWLKFHEEAVVNNSIYNNNDVSSNGSNLWINMRSLTDELNFENSSVRLGELKESQTIREAIVAIPYVNSVVDNNQNISDDKLSSEKQFFEIPTKRVEAALAVGTTKGDSDSSAGDSIRDLIANVQKYVLPPKFDFIADSSKAAIVMYFFEFEYKLDKDDLSYIWQNLAPRNYKKMEQKIQYSAHTLANNELLSPRDIIENENLRWMVFKVKQRGMAKYEDKLYRQAGSKETTEQTGGYQVDYNWPYDYVSFVEMVDVDAEVLMNKVNKTTGIQVIQAGNSDFGSAQEAFSNPELTLGNEQNQVLEAITSAFNANVD